jgi:hypothetical protein
MKDLLHWLLTYLTARYGKDQLDNRSTLVPRYADHQPFSKPVNSLKLGT